MNGFYRGITSAHSLPGIKSEISCIIGLFGRVAISLFEIVWIIKKLTYSELFYYRNNELFQFCFFVHYVLAYHWIKFFDF
jgi:hypothetical protein